MCLFDEPIFLPQNFIPMKKLLSIFLLLAFSSMLKAQPDCEATSAAFLWSSSSPCCYSAKWPNPNEGTCTGSWTVTGPGTNITSTNVQFLFFCAEVDGFYTVRHRVDGLPDALRTFEITGCSTDPCEELEAEFCYEGTRCYNAGVSYLENCDHFFTDNTEGDHTSSWIIKVRTIWGTMITQNLSGSDVSQNTVNYLTKDFVLPLSEIYEVCLVVENDFGCSDTSCVSSCGGIDLVFPVAGEQRPRLEMSNEMFVLKSNLVGRNQFMELEQIVPAPDDVKLFYRIVDRNGQIIQNSPLVNQYQAILTNQLTSGVYFLVIYNQDRNVPVAQKRFVVY